MLLPKWLPIVEAYLTERKEKAHEKTVSDHPIFAYCTVWLFDSGDFARGLEFAFAAIEYNQPMAGEIRRKWPGFIADTVYEWAEIQAEHGRSIEPYFGAVFKHVVSDWKLPEVVTAKFYKFAGLALLRTKNGEVKPSHVGDIERLKQADQLLEKAASLHRHAQVKTVRNKIEMRIRAIEELTSQGKEVPEEK